MGESEELEMCCSLGSLCSGERLELGCSEERKEVRRCWFAVKATKTSFIFSTKESITKASVDCVIVELSLIKTSLETSQRT